MHPYQTIDLTKRVNDKLAVYSDGAYSDPTLEIETWCTIATQGFWVSALRLGTQTGTHIDAPAHFATGGATLEALDVARLIGTYFYVQADALADEKQLARLQNGYDNEGILFLHGAAPAVRLPEAALAVLLGLACPVWVSSVAVSVIGRDPLYFHRALAENGRFLVEELDHEAARRVKPGGTVVALPLRLEGVSGSPCRVIVQNI